MSVKVSQLGYAVSRDPSPRGGAASRNERRQARRDREGIEEPGTDYSVEDDLVSAGHEPARRRSSGGCDHLVLAVSGRRPRCDVPLDEMNTKNSSPATRTLGWSIFEMARATVLFPAPGGPVTMISWDTVAMMHYSLPAGHEAAFGYRVKLNEKCPPAEEPVAVARSRRLLPRPPV